MKTQTSSNRIFTKIFFYEFRRIVLHKFYLGLLIICALFNWQILRTEIIRGVSHTAPFSAWSFGAYLGHSVPLVLLIIFFFLYQLYYGNDRHVQVLTSATSIRPQYYLLIRCTAIWSALFLLIAAAVIQGIIFLWSLFPSLFSPAELLLPALFIFLPVVSFSFGVGLCAIRFHPFVFFISAFLLLCGETLFALLWQNSSALTETLSLSGSAFFTAYPLTLADADAPFCVTGNIVIARILYFLAGSIGIFLGIRMNKK